LWNLKGKELPNLPQNHDKDKLSSLTFSRDSQMIVATCVDKNKLLIWKRKGNQWENSIISTTNNSDKQGFWDVDFSRDGKLIATAGKDGKIKLWSLEGKLLSTLTGHKDIVRSIRFSPDDKSKTLASASYDGTIKLWNLEGKAGLTFKKDFKGHEQRIININFSPDGKILASASFDGTAKLWDMNGNELKTLQGHTNWLTRVSFSPDGKTIATASDDKTIKLWNLEGQELQTILGHPSRVTNVTFSPDGKVLASSDGDDTHGTIILWDLQQIRNPDRLVKRGCKWVRDYLNYKAKLNNLSKSEEQANNLCKKLVPQL
jgi:WD40 repeat protein